MTIPFQTIDWSGIPIEEHKGESGTSYWKVIEISGLRIRLVEYTAGYLADHWCSKGHIVFCLKGEFYSELSGGKLIKLGTNMSYIVSNEASLHRSYSIDGATLFIIDGDFLQMD